jgi:SAM-dependent methyltransferase
VSASNPAPWGSSFRLVAAEKWKAKSAVLGSAVTEALVEYSCPTPGMRVLDLASGTGEPGISLAQRVPQGSVTAVDQSSELLDIAAKRARSKDLLNFITRQADAHELPFADQSFDLATCRFGVMFFSDAERALAELRRVLTPGARACFAAWGPIEQPYWQTTMKIVHRHVGGAMLESGGSDLVSILCPWLSLSGAHCLRISRGGGVDSPFTLDLAGRRGRSVRILLRSFSSVPADAGAGSGRTVAGDPG